MKSPYDFFRPLTEEEYAGLRADIAAHGQRFPIIRDQDGVTLDGHHRERVLRDLGIPSKEWKIETRTFADEDERFAFVISANHHRRQSTPDDRKRYAEHFAGLGWTQQKIAERLGVSQSTIRDDLRGLVVTTKPPRPKGGRPKGSGEPPRKHKYDEEIEDKAARLVLDEKKGVVKTAAALGVSEQVVIRSTERERGRREARAEPIIDPATLSLSAQEKYAAAVRQITRKLESEYTAKRSAEIEEHMRNYILPTYNEKLAEADAVVKARKGIFPLATFTLIRRCLHPDNSASADMRNQAFVAFEKLKLVLVKEAENPTRTPPPLPTYAELIKRRAEVMAKRKQRRQQGRDVPQTRSR